MQACLAHRDLLPGGQAAARPGRLRGPQLAGLASSHALCLLLHFFLLRGKLALKKQPGLTPVPGDRDPGGRAGPVAPPAPTHGDTWRNSHPDFSLPCYAGDRAYGCAITSDAVPAPVPATVLIQGTTSAWPVISRLLRQPSSGNSATSASATTGPTRGMMHSSLACSHSSGRGT